MLESIEPGHLLSAFEVLITSEKGDKLAVKDNFSFQQGKAQGEVVYVRPDLIKQTLLGIGSSFTESSAYILAHLDEEKRAEVMNSIFSEQGANFSIARTVIGATDFCVEGRYSYDDIEGDRALEHFSIDPDRDGFSSDIHIGVKDEDFDLLPMIQQAIAIKQKQDEQDLKIIASAWTAPAWMKDINDWYVNGTPENGYQGSGGVLKTEYAGIYADYLLKYLDAYRQEGVEIWGLTPVNEPGGNNGRWESMHFTAESQRDWIKNHLGPQLHRSGDHDTKILMFDHNRDELEAWADTIYSDPEASPFVYGAAVHWYESSFKVYEDVFDRVHDKYPGFSIIHTEGCIDDLGNDAPEGVLDPVRFKESDWFDNDGFWWNECATDWAYTATWEGVKTEDHPIYTPVHRYARNIIVSINHWLEAWIDWNIVLDRRGGPNHVGNFCGAPIMVDVDSAYVYYTPIYHILAQLSRTIRPGDRAVQTDKLIEKNEQDALHACATINANNLLSVQVLNTTKKAIDFSLQIDDQYAAVVIEGNALQTIRVQL